MIKTAFCVTIVATLALFAACDNRDDAAQRPSPTAPSDRPATAPTTDNSALDKWLGQWNGPEGTYLSLSKNGNQYAVKVQSLDGAAVYDGIGVGDRIEFKRNGTTESIHATSGKETGMKWLLEKTDCLTINLGEGLCRD